MYGKWEQSTYVIINVCLNILQNDSSSTTFPDKTLELALWHRAQAAACNTNIPYLSAGSSLIASFWTISLLGESQVLGPMSRIQESWMELLGSAWLSPGPLWSFGKWTQVFLLPVPPFIQINRLIYILKIYKISKCSGALLVCLLSQAFLTTEKAVTLLNSLRKIVGYNLHTIKFDAFQ